jgi:translation initiation factor 1 (eIF-1/SUI1)
MRKRPIALVMKCETPSKKKNYIHVSRETRISGRGITYIGGLDRHDKHDPTCYDDIQKSNDVHDSENVKNYKAAALLLH